MIKNVLLILFALISGVCFAQDILPNVKSSSFLQSPNAANLGQYGSIDISPFTGLPNIGIKVFSVSQGDITVNANLGYMAGGVKPEDHPGWVGQNWALNVGGVVTRKRNGGVDEFYDSNLQNGNPDTYSYLQHYDILNDPNWDSQTFLQNHQAGNPANPVLALLSPDEFLFTLPNGRSGSFFKNHLGEWAVKSSQPGKMYVEVSLNTSPVTIVNPVYNAFSLNITRMINKIVITDADGFKYTFGDNVDAIEFIRSPRSLSGNSYYTNEDVVANAWYLIKIQSPKGNVVNFSYVRGPMQFVQSPTYSHTLSYYLNLGSSTCSGNSISPISYSASCINPSYLSEISGSSFKVSFEKHVSKDPYLYGAIGTYSAYNGFIYSDMNNAHYGNGIFTNGAQLLDDNRTVWYKLTKVTVADLNNVPKETYTFGYNNDDIDNDPNAVGKRLFLTRFSREHPSAIGGLFDDDSTVPPINYKFSYRDPEMLPGYGSLMTDEWGYYNGKVYPFGSAEMNPNLLLSNLAPDTIYATKGMLTSINYPTGGFTRFAYEPNDYGAQVNRTPNAVTLSSVNGFGGGMRIKKIIEYSLDGPPTSKEYSYTKTQSPGTSSGIIAGRKQFLIQAQIGVSPYMGYATYISNNSKTDLDYTNGRDVVYSEVKEKMDDGSYNIYKYSSYDTPVYMDEVSNIYSSGYTIANTQYGPSYFTANSSYTYPVTAHTSREMERGQLLVKETHNAAGTLVYKQENQYRDDAARFNEFVRAFDYQQQSISCSSGTASERYIEPVKYYTYLPYLKSQTETTFDLAGNNPVNKVSNYTYDNNWRQMLDQSYTDSKGDVIRSSFKHAYDIDPVDDPNGQAASMLVNTRNMTAPVLKTINYNGTTQTSASKAIYDQPATGLIVPVSAYAQSQSTQPYFEVGTIHQYDLANGNVLSQSKSMQPRTSYIWGYAKQYPVAAATNAAWNEFYYEGFEETTGLPALTGLAHTGKRYYEGANYNVSWALPAGTSKTYVISFWYRDSGIWKFKTDNYTGPGYLCNVGNACDDISIYPKDAQVQTYNYEPLVGLTSTTDTKGEVTYFEYDIYNRLRMVKDKDHNITKALCYNLRGQSTGCPIPGLFYNAQMQGSYTKNDCVNGVGTTVTYVIPAGTFSSTVDVNDANAKASAALPVYGQAYANVNGSCYMYAKVNTTSSYSVVNSGYTQTFTTYAMGVYSDAGCTSPLIVNTPVTINYKIAILVTFGAGDPPINYVENHTVVIQAGTSSSSIGELVGGCSPPAGGGDPPAARAASTTQSKSSSVGKSQTTAKTSTGGAVTNGLPPGDPPGDPGDPHPSSVCNTNTITVLPGYSYIPVN
ncbi:MAG: DUF5977 domain-containing protein [Bacteroidota bacterium]